jgi:hypothetical protein
MAVNLQQIISALQEQNNPQSLNQNTNPTVDSSLGWNSMQGAGGLALGGVNSILSGLSYLDQRKTNKMKNALLGQQVASNQQTMDNIVADRAQVKSAFGA